jgi:GxxExxY protein
MNQEQVMNNLTHKVIGCAMSVYKALGNGFNEEIYQKALSLEFEMNGIDFIQDHEIDIIYKDNKIGKQIVDFYIEGSLMLEIKLVSEILEEHRIQGINLLEAFRISDGLLINFGGPSLEFKRVYNNKMKRG